MTGIAQDYLTYFGNISSGFTLNSSLRTWIFGFTLVLDLKQIADRKKRWRERESAESLRKEITLRLKAVLVRQNKLVWLPCSWIKSLLSKYYNSLGFSVIFFSVMDDTNVF